MYNPQKAGLQAERDRLQNTLDNKYTEVNNARLQYLAEIDGTGGTGKIGIQNIALAKKAEYEKLESDHQKLSASLTPAVVSLDSSLLTIKSAIKKENEVFAGLLNNGFLTRIEALNNLVKQNTALQWRYFLIVIILMLIELMPVLAKTMLPSGTYDDKVKWTEDMEREIAQSNQQKEKDLKELYNQLAKENDEAFIKTFFTTTEEDRNEKMRHQLSKWKTDSDESFDGFWERMKKDILTKQEN